MSNTGGGSSKSRSDIAWYGGQENALSGIFAPGGTFDQLMQGKPNAGFERQQTQGLEQIKRQQAQAGTLNTPLGTRMQADYLQQSNAAAGDNWLQSLFQFMQPAGQESRSKAWNFGI
jgi:hypothetical protein